MTSQQKDWGKGLVWTVAKFENGHALLECENCNISIPRSMLASTIKVGDSVTAEFYKAEEATTRKKNLAKAILREILQN